MWVSYSNTPTGTYLITSLDSYIPMWLMGNDNVFNYVEQK